MPKKTHTKQWASTRTSSVHQVCKIATPTKGKTWVQLGPEQNPRRIGATSVGLVKSDWCVYDRCGIGRRFQAGQYETERTGSMVTAKVDLLFSVLLRCSVSQTDALSNGRGFRKLFQGPRALKTRQQACDFWLQLLLNTSKTIKLQFTTAQSNYFETNSDWTMVRLFRKQFAIETIKGPLMFLCNYASDSHKSPFVTKLHKLLNLIAKNIST